MHANHCLHWSHWVCLHGVRNRKQTHLPVTSVIDTLTSGETPSWKSSPSVQ
jgi:hypothetical protein